MSEGLGRCLLTAYQYSMQMVGQFWMQINRHRKRLFNFGEKVTSTLGHYKFFPHVNQCFTCVVNVFTL